MGCFRSVAGLMLRYGLPRGTYCCCQRCCCGRSRCSRCVRMLPCHCCHRRHRNAVCSGPHCPPCPCFAPPSAQQPTLRLPPLLACSCKRRCTRRRPSTATCRGCTWRYPRPRCRTSCLAAATSSTAAWRTPPRVGWGPGLGWSGLVCWQCNRNGAQGAWGSSVNAAGQAVEQAACRLGLVASTAALTLPPPLPPPRRPRRVPRPHAGRQRDQGQLRAGGGVQPGGGGRVGLQGQVWGRGGGGVNRVGGAGGLHGGLGRRELTGQHCNTAASPAPALPKLPGRPRPTSHALLLCSAATWRASRCRACTPWPPWSAASPACRRSTPRWRRSWPPTQARVQLLGGACTDVG